MYRSNMCENEENFKEINSRTRKKNHRHYLPITNYGNVTKIAIARKV